MINSIPDEKIAIILKTYAYCHDFFDAIVIDYPPQEKYHLTVNEYFESLDSYELQTKGVEQADLVDQFVSFLENMEARQKSVQWNIESLTIVGGQNKHGEQENVSICLRPGDVVSIVGPTGSGKSRLLGDIEWLAQGDTPTKRQILINDTIPPQSWRFSIEHKLVAQLSQNMNFVMDLTVAEFIKMHGESRMIGDIEEKIRLILEKANELAGEEISLDTPVTALSGGQSRALMIADTAFLSSSPIVLIDEIENAGIDRKIAISLLVTNEKIVLIATHDPVLALSAERRIVIKNGGIEKIIATSRTEKELLHELEALNQKLMNYRERLRTGGSF
ncbi:ATP-binding cassette domain-containing protein [Acetobacterium sp.]|jgi:ABC-type lipoprotein export system ATPase subunit|uniref:ATP-binding cassette domain-containing protein n=1 Tax=Acetobacterium sp. TaxID=1872094 RepID=UPI000CB2E844|nr:ATP-binding cassette domain-containing protein [Acetobacterium sp.]MDO9490900.1 ATP-binding cassette domain-containing protein [Acetobacterium sp.]PKM74969.1 MAG: ABC transporter [Firmicutes bacterium HGW-Firmicutes-17]